jgi:hypothetical protein
VDFGSLTPQKDFLEEIRVKRKLRKRDVDSVKAIIENGSIIGERMVDKLKLKVRKLDERASQTEQKQR